MAKQSTEGRSASPLVRSGGIVAWIVVVLVVLTIVTLVSFGSAEWLAVFLPLMLGPLGLALLWPHRRQPIVLTSLIVIAVASVPLFDLGISYPQRAPLLNVCI